MSKVGDNQETVTQRELHIGVWEKTFAQFQVEVG